MEQNEENLDKTISLMNELKDKIQQTEGIIKGLIIGVTVMILIQFVLIIYIVLT